MKKAMAGRGHDEGRAPRCPGGRWAHLLGKAEEGAQQSALDLWAGSRQPGRLGFASLPPVFLVHCPGPVPPFHLNLARMAEIY